ncbi:DUF1254 domain-containing protein [Alsobacter sp. R-9]
MRLHWRLLHTLALGLVLAGLVHLTAVLAIPALTHPNADERLAALAPRHAMTVLPQAGPAQSALPHRDPSAVLAVCRYDLAEGPLRVRATPGDAFMSFAFYTPTGAVYYAMTDRSALRGVIDLVVVTQAQLDELVAGDPEDEPVRELRLVSPQRTGFVTVRTLALEPGLQPEAEARVRSATCGHDIQATGTVAPTQAAPTQRPHD